MVAVPASQFALAASGFVVLAAAGRTTSTTVFAAVSAFYLLLNTVGRGVVASVELELTRALSVARAVHVPGARAARAVLPRALVLVVGAAVAAAATAPLLLRVVGGDVAAVGLLVVGTATLAVSYAIRGPLAAHERHAAYAATYLVEAAVCVLGAAALAIAGVDDVAAWAAVFVAAPLVAVLAVGPVLLRGGSRGWRDGLVRLRAAGPPTAPTAIPDSTAVTLRGLLWSALLFLTSQGVWNLAAVVVTAREVPAPAVAAGFSAVAVLLRAPVLAFPAIQALLLPRVSVESTRGERALLRSLVRGHSLPLGIGAVLWIAIALLLVPPVTRVVFGVEDVPGHGILAALGLSALVGAAVQLLQTQLIADGRTPRAAVAWALGLLVLLGGAVLPFDAPDAAAAAQLTATVVAGGVMTVSLWGTEQRASRGG